MNPETIDSEYAKLEQQAGQVAQAISAFSQKLQQASSGGDATAEGYLVDLQSLALQVQQEQLQMQALLQAVHDFTVSNLSEASAQTPQAAKPQYAPQPAYTAQPAQQRGGGMMSRFSGGGFGRAILSGAGFGIGNDLIRSIIR